MGQDDERPDDAGSDPRLKELGEKLAEARRVSSDPGGGRLRSSELSGYGQAMKIGSEFIAGVIVGFVIGYTIDQFFGTKPWGMIVFLLLGFAAGTLNVMRATGLAEDPFAAGAQNARKRAKDDKD